MGKLYDKVYEKEFIKLSKVKKSEYQKAKQTLSKEEFEKFYTLKPDGDYYNYYKKSYEIIPENEFDLYLLYETLEQQRKASSNIESVKNIIIGLILANIIGAIIIAIIIFI